jgi:hypothetical protein
LFSRELTGCSMTADNCHGADEREFERASEIFCRLRISRPRSAIAGCAE